MPDKTKDYCAVFKHGTLYVVAAGELPDLHESHRPTKLEALLAARRFQIERGGDPNFVLDLTNAGSDELAAFLR